MDKAGILLLLTGIFWYWIRIDRPREEKKRRERQMMADHAEIIASLTVLTAAGLSLPQAWLRLSNEYEENRKPREVRYLYNRGKAWKARRP